MIMCYSSNMDILKKLIDRRDNIIKLRKEGKTLVEIGKIFNISRERVRQITLKKYELTLKPEKYQCSCSACKKEFIVTTVYNLRNRKFCDDCSNHLKKFGGRERTRELVRIRDNYTCQKCGKIWNEDMRRFDVHHKNDTKGESTRSCDLLSDMENMITLCHKCHLNLPQSIKNMKNAKKISKYIKGRINLLSKKGLTNGEIAKLLGISYPLVSRYLIKKNKFN